MKKTRHRFVNTLFAIIINTLVFGFAIPAKAAEPVDQKGLVDKAHATFQSFMVDSNMAYLKDHLREAKGLLIVPSMLKAGFWIGGSGGSGVLIVKDAKTGQWSQPAFYTLGSVSFGIQFGGEGAEVIMMVRTQKAVDKLLTSSFKLGGDTSIAVGPVGAGAKSDIMADIFFLFAVQRSLCRNCPGRRCHLDKGQMEQCVLWKGGHASRHSCNSQCKQFQFS